MGVSDVKRAAAQIVLDTKVKANEVNTLMSSTGGSIDPKEEKALKEIVAQWQADGVMEPAASTQLNKYLADMSSARIRIAKRNDRVQQLAPQLSADIQARMTVGKQTTTFGGTQIPDAVKNVVNKALAEGAVAYDVREVKPNPVFDLGHDNDPSVGVDGKFNPYEQESTAVDTLAFSYTELNPQRIAEEMSKPLTFKVESGVETTPSGGHIVQFKDATMKPNGSITSNYDDYHWPVTTARGPGGEKYASNFAILADGSFHAVPWSRRSKGDPSLILTTASLARGKQMLFNGHINMSGGVVTYIGRSGRLGSLAEDGTKFVDPIALLQAWGFKTRPGLTVTQE